MEGGVGKGYHDLAGCDVVLRVRVDEAVVNLGDLRIG